VTKEEIDSYFTSNIQKITDIIKQHRSKCATANVIDITTDIYLLCVEKADIIQESKIDNFIGSASLILYKYSTSPFNYKTNKVFANEIEHDYIYEEESIGLDIQIQNMEYLFQKYLIDARPSEVLFFDLYVNQGIRSVRKIKEKLNISHYGAYTLINDFKQKIKEYERKAKFDEA
jgi:hypothetical protein